MNLHEAQDILNRYKFVENGVELFPRDAAQLTKPQLAKLAYHAEQVAYLGSLKATEKRLEKLKSTLANQ